MGECIRFYKNFSKERFYDGSSLLAREWERTILTFPDHSLREGSEPPKYRHAMVFEILIHSKGVLSHTNTGLQSEDVKNPMVR